MSAPYLLMYDIPETVKIGNPTRWLRPIAVRMNKSVWIIQEDNIPYRQLDELEHHGVTWYTIPFDVRAMGDIVEVVIRSVVADIRGVVQRSNDSCAKLTRTIRGRKGLVADKVKLHRKKVAPILRKMGREIIALRSAAQTFGVDPIAIGYEAAESSIRGLRSAMLTKGKTMLEAARQLELTYPNDPMAKAVRTGGVPAGVLSDYLEDKGMNTEPMRKLVKYW